MSEKQETQKKVVGRTVAIAAGVICIILAASLAAAIAYYTVTINDKNAAYDTYASSHSHTNSEYQSYVDTHNHTNSEYDDYVSTHSHNNSDYDSLVSQLNVLKNANVFKVGLKADDERPFLQTPRLHVYGYLFNAGINTANNVRLHVVAIQDAVTAIDTYIDIGAISGQTWTFVDTNVYYSGTALASWTVTPEWA